MATSDWRISAEALTAGTVERSKPNSRANRFAASAGWLVAAVSVAGYLWLLLPQLGKPLVYDDVNFALGARAVAQTGRPYGNQGYLLHLYDQREQWALWHPPLYVYTLGIAMAAFGTSEAAARSVGVLCQLGCAVLVFDLARRGVRAGGAPRDASGIAGGAAVAFYLFSPLTIQSALILDIDNTLLPLLMTLFVWLCVRDPGIWRPATTVGLAGLFGVLLWTKVTTPLVLLVAVIFTRHFQPVGWRGAAQALVVGVCGAVGFAITWLIVTEATGMPRDYTFDVIYYEAIESGRSTRERFASWDAFANGVAPAQMWIGPLFTLLFMAVGVGALARLMAGRGLLAFDLVVVLGAAAYLPYMMKLAGSFPKYHAPLLPLWAATVGSGLVAWSWPLSRRSATTFALCFALAVAWYRWRMPSTWTIEWTDGVVRWLLVAPLAAAALVALTAARPHIQRSSRTLFAVLAAFALGWSVALDVHQRGLPTSTTYYYGRHGQVETAQALAAIIGPDELYVAAKEVAWYSANQRYVDQDSWHDVVWARGGGVFDGTWLGTPVRVLALEVGEPSFRVAYEGALTPRYRVAGEFGNFALYVRQQ